MKRSTEREQYLIQTAEDVGFVSIADAAKHLDVSIETVRRDINKLCALGLFQKTHGGAVPTKAPFKRDAPYARRTMDNKEQKLSVGAAASRLIFDNAVVALDCGVSIQSVALNIQGVKGVTFVTNSLPIANILLHKISIGEIDGRIIFIGGELDIESRFSRGSAPVELAERFNFDVAFISCTAVSASAVSSFSLDECAFSTQLLKRSRTSVLVADSAKVGKSSLFSFAKAGDFSKLIVDDKRAVTAEFERVLKESGTELIIADKMHKKAGGVF